MAATVADAVLMSVTAKTNFKAQLQPFIYPGFFMRWHLEKVETLINTCDAFVSISKWSNELIKINGWYKNNCKLISTGLLNPFTITNQRVYDGAQPLKIVFMGRLFPVKGVDILIKAVKDIPPQKAELHIYGPKDSEHYSEYFELCTKLAAGAANIYFYKPVENEKVVEVLSNYDVLCIPSRGNEMAPLVIQEAFAAGLPVIGANLPAVKEWVEHKINGLIFSVDNHNDLADKLLMLINDSSLLQLLKKGLPEPNSFEEVVNKYEELYQTLLSKN